MVRLEREMAMSAVVQVGKTTPLDGTSRACERLRMAADLESGASRCLLLLASGSAHFTGAFYWRYGRVNFLLV
jgi:hypothetical protein